MMEWQPIETAPQDGTYILAINARTNRTRQHVVYYRETWRTNPAPMSFIEGLTHWMPLPAPPETKEVKE